MSQESPGLALDLALRFDTDKRRCFCRGASSRQTEVRGWERRCFNDHSSIARFSGETRQACLVLRAASVSCTARAICWCYWTSSDGSRSQRVSASWSTTHVKKASIARMRSRLGSWRALGVRSKTIAWGVSSEKVGHAGRAGPLGSPLLAKLIQ